MFPTPVEMQQNLTKHGRKMVTIVDPHMKRDDGYHIHKEATAKGLYIKNKVNRSGVVCILGVFLLVMWWGNPSGLTSQALLCQ